MPFSLVFSSFSQWHLLFLFYFIIFWDKGNIHWNKLKNCNIRIVFIGAFSSNPEGNVENKGGKLGLRSDWWGFKVEDYSKNSNLNSTRTYNAIWSNLSYVQIGPDKKFIFVCIVTWIRLDLTRSDWLAKIQPDQVWFLFRILSKLKVFLSGRVICPPRLVKVTRMNIFAWSNLGGWFG